MSAILCSVIVQAQEIERFVSWQMQNYPKSRLLDIYKSCFQDYMGAEHLVSDAESAKNYLDIELSQCKPGDFAPWYYEPCGVNGQFVRVSLRGVAERAITKAELLGAFVWSSRKERPSVENWKAEWHKIIGTIEQMSLSLPHYKQDKLFIDSILSVGKYAISHSADYRKAYKPHYRIVAREIFEAELKEKLEPQQLKFEYLYVKP